MQYAILDLELTRPLPTVSLSADERGVAVLLRRNGRPIHFFLHELPPSTLLAPDELGQLLSDAAAVELVRDVLLDELSARDGTPGPVSLTVAVCTRNRVADLRACLESLVAIGPPEILVVDNAPPDEATRELVATFEGVRYAREDRPGLDFARNRALRESSAEFIAFLDDDTVADRGWLAGLEEALAEQPDAAIVTGLVLPFELETRAQLFFELGGGFRRGFSKLRYAGERLAGNAVYPTGAGMFGAGCNMVVRREAVLGLGGFDEALDTGPPLPGGGDLDVFYRVLRAGHALAYEPRMLVFHKHRRDYGALRRQYWTWGTGFMAFVAKTYGSDPEVRPRLRRLVSWWLGYETRRVLKGVRGRSPHSVELALAELGGGLIGLAGTYRRSVRRTERIRSRLR